jgi:hypothetical protein
MAMGTTTTTTGQRGAELLAEQAALARRARDHFFTEGAAAVARLLAQRAARAAMVAWGKWRARVGLFYRCTQMMVRCLDRIVHRALARAWLGWLKGGQQQVASYAGVAATAADLILPAPPQHPLSFSPSPPPPPLIESWWEENEAVGVAMAASRMPPPPPPLPEDPSLSSQPQLHSGHYRELDFDFDLEDHNETTDGPPPPPPPPPRMASASTADTFDLV